MDCVFVEGLDVYAYHGVTDAEQEVGRRYRFDVRLYLDAQPAAEWDYVGKTVDYGEAVRIILTEATGHKVKVVEHLAEQITQALFSAFPAAKRIRLRVAKLDPPVGVVVEAAGIEIERERPAEND